MTISNEVKQAIQQELSPIEIFNLFLESVFTGNMEQALELVDPSAQFINDVAGTLIGHEGAKQFFGAFGAVFIPGTFEVEVRFSDGINLSFYGKLSHTVKSTGKQFKSDWVLIGKVLDGKIVRYRFYEDTLALHQAMQ